MENVLNVLLEITIYSFTIYGAILIFKKVFHKHISAALNYAIWGILVLRLLLPVTINSGFSFIVITKESTAQTVQTGNSINRPGLIQEQNTQTDVQNNTQNAEDEPVIQKTEDELVNDISTQKPVALNIDWQTVLVLLWAMGVLGFLIYMTILWLQLNKNIKKCEIKPPEYVLRLVETCKKDLGIKANIEVSIHDWLNSPALCSCLIPKLLIPESMLDKMDIRQLEFGVRHELTHYRHKDHLVTLLLTLLRCVYWFNPVVWIASQQIKTDMETVCDVSVTSRLGNKERMRYINTMIDLSGDNGTQYILRMGLDNERKSLEKRIRGIFMKKRTKPSVRLIAVMIASIMFIMCFTTACQPTPSTAAIVNKNDGKLEAKIQQTQEPGTSPTPYAIPSHWTETVNDEKVNIKIDTDVKLPYVSAYPVIKVEPAIFTQQQVDKFVDYFAAGKKFYLPRSRTKADIEGELVKAKKDAPNFDDHNEPIIKELEDEIAKAPAEDTPKIYTGTALTYSYKQETGKENIPGGKNFLNVEIENSDGKDGFINFMNYVKGFTDSTSFGYSANDSTYTSENVYKSLIKNSTEEKAGLVGYGALYDKVKITQKEAETKAQKVMDDLGIKDMILYEASRAVSSEYPDKGGYELKYLRGSGGIPGYEDSTWNVSPDEQPPQYSPPFSTEALSMVVTEDGIQHFDCRGITNVVESVNSNVALLPFDKVEKALKNQIKYKKSFLLTEDFAGKDLTITVISAELRVYYIGVKDNENQALLVPVWVFKTEQSYFNTVMNKQLSSQDNNYVLNAIDGGVIDLNLTKDTERAETIENNN